MRFFFADSQDLINPGFDFDKEEHPGHHVRQRDDAYPHEALTSSPYDGMLISKSIVDGSTQQPGRYTVAQRNRLRRLGVRNFLRLDDRPTAKFLTMGDCGAFSYVNEAEPPYSVPEMLDFYAECGFDLGVSIDHVILGFIDDEGSSDQRLVEWRRRQELTLELAAEFIDTHRARGLRFVPVGVAQGWSPASYASAVVRLQTLGYERIALGGMVPLKTRDVLSVLRGVSPVLADGTQLHLLGITRCEHVSEFARCGVTSFDTTSPLRQAFMDNDDNYYWVGHNFTAIRVPQVDGNTKLRLKIRAGQIDQSKALRQERRCLELLVGFDAGIEPVGDVLAALREYATLLGLPGDRTAVYRELLEARPWKDCSCGLCAKDGIQVVIFRGAERNRRRGFHNLHMFRARLNVELSRSEPKTLIGAPS